MEDFVCCSIINFQDGTSEAMILHVGDVKSCERVADLIPAVSYSGDKPVKGARMAVLPRVTFDAHFTQQSD